MELLETKNFELAVYKRGDEAAEKLMLCLPGRLDTKDYAHMHSHVEYFAERGYLAVSFDPPGTWESPGTMEEYTMTNYLKAINEIIEHFGNRPTVLLGHSRGGSMAMLAGSTNDAVTHFITVLSRVAESSPSQKALDAGVYVSKRDTPAQYTEAEITFELPLSYFDDCKQYDLAALMAVCTKPKLLFYGTEDPLITEADVRSAYEVAAEPKEIQELVCGHDYRRYPDIIKQVNERAARFLG